MSMSFMDRRYHWSLPKGSFGGLELELQRIQAFSSVPVSVFLSQRNLGFRLHFEFAGCSPA